MKPLSAAEERALIHALTLFRYHGHADFKDGPPVASERRLGMALRLAGKAGLRRALVDALIRTPVLKVDATLLEPWDEPPKPRPARKPKRRGAWRNQTGRV